MSAYKKLFALLSVLLLVHFVTFADDAVTKFLEEEQENLRNAKALQKEMKNIIFEAEDMAVDGEGWGIKTYSKGWNPSGAASGQKFLDGRNGVQGTAKYELSIPGGGEYTLWVRYLDLSARRENNGFKVTVKQGKTVVAEKFFDEGPKAMRRDRDSIAKWGGGNAQLVWDSIRFQVPDKGKLTVELSKPVGKITDEWGRLVDCFILSCSKDYVPKSSDLTSLYLKIAMHKDQPSKVPVIITGGSAILNAGGKQFFEGHNSWSIANGIAPGEETEWLDLGKYLAPDKTNTVRFAAPPQKPNPFNPSMPEGTSGFTLKFSRSASDADIIKEVTRSGAWYGVTCLITPSAPDAEKVKSDMDYTNRSLVFAKDTPAYPNGKRPVRFPFGATMAVAPMYAAPETVQGELTAQSIIGLNSLGNPWFDMTPLALENGFNHASANCSVWMMNEGCLCSPQTEKMKEAMKKELGKLRPEIIKNAESVGIMDEPAFGVSSVMDCKSKTVKCSERYIGFLKENKVNPADLGVKDLSEARLSRDPATGANFYWTVRYRNDVVVKMLRACQDAVHSVRSDLPADVNIATEIVANGNMVQFGMDWFEIYGSGALEYGLTEDWSNMQKTYQLGSYMMDVMRSAAKHRKQKFGMLNILCWRSEWEITAKGFAEIGHGARSMGFFRYGPGWTGASDSMNHIRDIYPAIKAVTLCTGAVEDHLLDGKTAQGDAAILLSVTGDVWNILSFNNVFGKERMYLSLLLLHCGIRTDILSEQDIVSELPKYRMLFVTDQNIRKEYAKPLLDWVKKGGILYMSAGALMYDEYNRDLGFDIGAGISRGNFYHPKPKEKSLLEDKSIATDKGRIGISSGMQTVANGNILCFNEEGKGVISEFSLGKGRIIFCGFFPALGYVLSDSKKVENSAYSHREYPETHRSLMKDFIRTAGIVPKVSTDQPMVEATFTESAKADVITLSNWNFSELDTVVTLNSPVRYKSIRSIAGKTDSVSLENGRTVIRLKVKAGDHIECIK